MISSNREIKFPWNITEAYDLCGDYDEELIAFLANPPEGIVIEEGDMADEAIGGEIRSMEVLEKLLHLFSDTENHHIEFTDEDQTDMNLEFSHTEGNTTFWEQ
jgi:hypothetical protein